MRLKPPSLIIAAAQGTGPRNGGWRAGCGGATHLKVLPNPTFDVPGGAKQCEDMVWVYSDKSRHWWERLSHGLKVQLKEDWFNFRTTRR